MGGINVQEGIGNVLPLLESLVLGNFKIVSLPVDLNELRGKKVPLDW
jgi:hypothetical protein